MHTASTHNMPMRSCHFLCFAEYQGPVPDLFDFKEKTSTQVSFERLPPIVSDPPDEYWANLLPQVYTRNLKLLYTSSQTTEEEVDLLWQIFLQQQKSFVEGDFDTKLIDMKNGSRIYHWTGPIWHADPIVRLAQVAPFKDEQMWCNCCLRVKVVKNEQQGWFCAYCYNDIAIEMKMVSKWTHHEKYCVLKQQRQFLLSKQPKTAEELKEDNHCSTRTVQFEDEQKSEEKKYEDVDMTKKRQVSINQAYLESGCKSTIVHKEPHHHTMSNMRWLFEGPKIIINKDNCKCTVCMIVPPSNNFADE
jgi:hypothetical protein